ncbi:hypothetical protein [Shinella zoogloeoides]|uniref:Phage tail protein n=1 Tax=Shinella zoogloeoides TaxID=352475 RepID=A0A6N8TGM5_SHIZO|nr:hypothetical protein [Shinella zoogloeoides]MXO01575.1 hypothetical protein [Shinella zoogloeoides]UEX80187.1 hypothetical protein K8M09_11160 [Shinella zoogloeoides]
MADTTEHLLIPKPNRARVPSRNIDEQFDELALALDMVDAFIHALRQAVVLLAPADHDQAMETITGLVDALNAKMPADRQFKLDDLTDVDGATAAPVNYVLVKSSGGLFVPSTALAALGVHPHLISEVTGLVTALTDRPTRDEVAAGLDVLNDDLMAEIQKRGVPIGTMVHSAVPLEAYGYLLANGAPCTPVTPELRAALLAAGSPFGHNGTDPLLPDEVTANRFRRAAGGSLPVGSVQADQMQRITGSIRVRSTDVAGSAFVVAADGAFSASTQTGPSASGTTVGTTRGQDVLTLDTANSPGARTGDETRPKGITYLPYIKAFGAITIEGMADLSALFNALATEMEAVAGTDNTKLMTALRVRQAMRLRNGGTIALSGTSVELTGIPADVQRVTLDVDATFSTNVGPRLELGDASSFAGSGYSGAAARFVTTGSSAAASSASFFDDGASQTSRLARYVLTKQSGNAWHIEVSGQYGAGGAFFGYGKATGLSAALSRLRLSTGSAATMSGTAKIWWEF